MAAAGNSFEGGTAGVAVSVANSGGGSGDAFNNVSVGSGGTLAYDSLHPAHGSRGLKVATAATVTTVHAAYTTAVGTQTTIYGRAYLYLPTNPANVWRLFWARGAGAGRAAVCISSTGKLQALNAAGTVLFNTTVSVPLSAVFRVEWKMVFSTTVGLVEVKLFTTPDGTSPAETQTSAATQNLGGANADEYRYGVLTSQANVGPFWLDDLRLDPAGYPGAAGSSVAASVNVPAAGTITVAALPPVAGGATAVAVPAAAFTLTARVPVLTVGATATAPAATITFAALAPTPSYGAALAVPAATFTLAALPPMVATLAAVAVPVAMFTFAAVAPQLAYNTAVNVPAAALTLTAVPPEVSYGAAITVPAAAFTLTAPVPVVSEGSTVNVAAGGAFTFVAAPPEVGYGAATTPPAATFTFAALAPVTVGGAATIDAPAATIVLAAPEPQVAAGAPVDVPAATIVLAVVAPQLSIGAGIGAVIQPSGPIIIFAAYPPSVSAQGLPTTRRIRTDGREAQREVAGREAILVTAGRERGTP